MILEHKKIVIFSYPRCATKLIANILKDFNYHSYGEWYDVWASKIEGNTAIRLSTDEIKKIKERGKVELNRLYADQTVQLVKLNELWKETHKNLNPTSWTLTLWSSNLWNLPFILENFKDCHWLCPVRDRWTQILSWFISFYNNNYNGQIQSNPVTISKILFENHYWMLRRTEISQNWVLDNFSGTRVPFDLLTNGTFEGFGSSYHINSKDEHSLLEPLVLNLDEIKECFYQLENTKG